MADGGSIWEICLEFDNSYLCNTTGDANGDTYDAANRVDTQKTQDVTSQLMS